MSYNSKSPHQVSLLPTKNCSLSRLIQINNYLNATYFNVVADYVHPFMATIFPSSHCYFQQNNAPCHKANCFHEHDNEYSVLQWSSQSLNLTCLGCGTGDWQYESKLEKICKICLMYSYNHEPES